MSLNENFTNSYKINNLILKMQYKNTERILDKDKIYSSLSFFNANRAKLTALKS